MKSEKVRGWKEPPEVFLCDNGSLEVTAIHALRGAASALGRKVDRTIRPVGLLHSDRVDPAVLDGEPAAVLLPELRQLLARGERAFFVLPFFLGPSRGVTEWLPGQLNELFEEWPDLRVQVASCLFKEGDDRLAEALADRVRAVMAKGEFQHPPCVAMVDHGTPSREVNEARERVGNQLRELLQDEVSSVATCSMERRSQSEYDFNEPLLENLLRDQGACPAEEVVVAQFFLSPGRHAGPGGDVARICRESEQARPGLRTVLTEPLGDHPLVLEILKERLRECLDAD